MNAPMTVGGWTLGISAMALAFCACNASGEKRDNAATPGSAGGSHSTSSAPTSSGATSVQGTGGLGTGGGSSDARVNSTRQATGGTSGSGTGGSEKTTNPSGGAPGSTGSGSSKTTTNPSGGTPSSTPSGGNGGVGTGASTSTGTAPVLCVFDYDLTLSTHACGDTEGDPASLCRVATDCGVYGWSDQCMAKHARAAVAECVRRGAYIGIASHSPFEGCWDDKIVPIVTEHQFPEFTDSPHYDSQSAGFTYPAVDDKDNWNCEDCVYQMLTSVTKSLGISRIMRHYGMDPDSPSDRKRVLFWDDDPNNIKNVETNMPEVISVTVPRHGATGADGGCGITPGNVDEAWSQIL